MMAQASKKSTESEVIELDDFDQKAALLVAVSKREFKPGAREWLGRAVSDFLAAAGSKSLEECLGLTVPRGSRGMPRRIAQARRRAALVTAWHAMLDCAHYTPWKRVEILANEIRDFGLYRWPEWRVTGIPPRASVLSSALFEAFSAIDAPPPQNPKTLHVLLKSEGALT